MKKIAIILCNLGGPDKKESVKPFLFNLFNDKAIISLPNPFRYFIAKLISSKREKVAQEIYDKIGGGSPILEQTKSQTRELSEILKRDNYEYRIFIAMRYWYPFTENVISDLKKYQADEVVFLPLYPQFSTTTTGSSFECFYKLFSKNFSNIKLKTICCYPQNDNFIKAHINELSKKIESAQSEINNKNVKLKILFSAHGLPEKIIKSGDPYQWQVEKSVEKIINKMEKKLDYIICYQSRVGPLKWIGPSTDKVIEESARKKEAIIIVPIAFVSEHSETLVELDIEYKKLFKDNGGEYYYRVPALKINEYYLQSLANMVEFATNLDNGTITSDQGSRICPNNFSKCICNN